MKNITVFTVLVIMAYGVQVVSAQEKPENSHAISLGYQFGFIHGQAEEIVYPIDTKGKYLSQLLWDMKPVLYNGLTLDFLPVNPMKKPSAFFNFSLKYGIPGLSGKMEDRDWRSTENAALTDFSTHDNDVRELFFLDACGGFSFPLVGFLLLKPFINVSSMTFRFSGMDGSGIYARPIGGGYAPINDNPREQPYYGRVINYTQEWLYIAPGFSLGFSFLNVFLAELSFQISPFISCGDLDEHLTTNNQFKDLMWGGLLLESGFQFSYSPIQWLEFSAFFSWRNIEGTKGQTYRRKPIGTGIYQPEGTAGAGLSILNTGLCLKVRL